MVTDLEAELRKMGVDSIYKAYPLAGVEVDMLLVHKGKSYCLDIVGFPGAFAHALSISQIEILHRMEHDVICMPYSTWHLNRNICLDYLWRLLV